jgi:signal transduction histidine kinase
MNSFRSFFTANAWIAFRFLSGLVFAGMLMASMYALNWSMSADAFGMVSQGKIQVLRQATLGLGPELEAVPDGAVQTSLPHRIEDANVGFAHFRLFFNVNATPYQRNLAMCVPRWSANASVWVDGKVLLSHEKNDLDFKTLFRPTFIPLPLQLAPGEHRIDIRLRTLDGAFPGLSEVWFGGHETLARECGELQDLLVGMRIGGLFLMLFITLVAAAVFASERDGLSLGFALAGLGWCLHALVVLGWLGPMNNNTWITWFMVTRPMTGFAGIYVALRLVKRRHSSLEWGLLGLSLLAFLVLLFLPMAHWQKWLLAVASILVPATLIMGVYLLWYASAKSRYLSDFAFATSMFFGVGANALDLARANDLLPYSALSMTHWLAPLLGLAIGLLVVERLVRYLQYKKEASAQLKQELATQKIQLASYHEELQTQREKTLLAEERQRLVRDMHDGLGSQLVSASALLKSSQSPDTKSAELAELIDHALLDLRSVLDVFSSTNNPDINDRQDAVSVLLGMLRHRLAPVFRSQAIEFDWQSEPLPHEFLQGDRDRLQLLRLLQEACANIIKHAQAKLVTFRIHVSDSAIVFEVRDDGRGMDASKAEPRKRTGQGMSSMAARATRLGAQLAIDSSDEGTCIRLNFER